MSGPAKASAPKKAAYQKELRKLQVELVNMQHWVIAAGARVVVVFEGRDAAGKGGAIKRVAQYLNPRAARVVALPTPDEREKGQWYFQRYIEHLPTKGEIVLMDRSWYNRAGVEHVLGYCTPEQYELFLRQVPVVERMLVDDGIILLKYWFSVSDEEQEKRFKSRLKDPMRRWKLSETDLESITKWEAYSRAKDDMFAVTDLPEARRASCTGTCRMSRGSCRRSKSWKRSSPFVLRRARVLAKPIVRGDQGQLDEPAVAERGEEAGRWLELSDRRLDAHLRCADRRDIDLVAGRRHGCGGFPDCPQIDTTRVMSWVGCMSVRLARAVSRGAPRRSPGIAPRSPATGSLRRCRRSHGR